MLDEPSAVKVLDRLDDPAVHPAAVLLEEALVGDILGERMLESVNTAVWSDPFVDELTLLQLIEMQREVATFPNGVEEPR